MGSTYNNESTTSSYLKSIENKEFEEFQETVENIKMNLRKMQKYFKSNCSQNVLNKRMAPVIKDERFKNLFSMRQVSLLT